MSFVLDQQYFTESYFPPYGPAWAFDNPLIRVGEIKGRGATGRLLFCGVAYGYIVQRAVEAGLDAYGVELSDWAISQVPPEIAGRVVKADCTSSTSMANARAALIGGGPTRRFDFIVTEDLLPALTDAEIPLCLAALRAIIAANRRLIHFISTNDGLGDRHPPWNWKSGAEWKALVGGDIVFDIEQWIEVA